MRIVGFGKGYPTRYAMRRILPIMYPRPLKSDTRRAVNISGVFRGVVCDRSFRKRTVYKSEIIPSAI